jgi:single-stranded-DNA-specific exonuclease
MSTQFWKSNEKYQLLKNQLKIAKEWIHAAKHIYVLTHKDVDGLCSYFLLNKLLLSQGKRFDIEPIILLTPKKYQTLEQEIKRSDLIILADIGASFSKKIQELNTKVIILDHHELEPNTDPITPLVLNISPFFWENDNFGQKRSGASLSYALAREFLPYSLELLLDVMLGLEGDRQLNSENCLNSEILQEGLKRGDIKEVQNFLYASQEHISSFLQYSTSPFFPHFFGQSENIKIFLKNNNIFDKPLNEFTKNEIETLKACLDEEGKNWRAEIKDYTFRKRYYFTDGNINFEFFYQALLLGHFKLSYYQIFWFNTMLKNKATIKRQHKVFLKKFIGYVLYFLKDHHIKNEGPFYQIDVKTRLEYSSIIIGLVNDYVLEHDKPLLIFQENPMYPEKTNFSVRAKSTNTYNFGKAFNLFCEKFGGAGGGHKNAAGGSIAIENKRAFLQALKKDMLLV